MPEAPAGVARLLLATTNSAKAARLRSLLRGLPVQLLTPTALAGTPDLAEGDDSLLANAERKARAWAAYASIPALATDGGLEVPALGSRWNAATTRRAAGPGATDRQRAEHLLELARDLPPKDRLAFQVEAAALALPDGRIAGSWLQRGPARLLADSYDPAGVPAGFWLPGVLLFEPGRRRYSALTAQERHAVGEHWIGLGPALRRAVKALLGEAHAQRGRVVPLAGEPQEPIASESTR